MKKAKRTIDQFNRNWIIENSLEIIPQYEKGVLTIRSLYYQLVGRGMTNSQPHYKRVVGAMIVARRDGRVDFDQFTDHDRGMTSETQGEFTDLQESISLAKRQISLWMNNYVKNRWENQPYYPEVLIEKNALIGVFKKPCDKLRIGFGACKGYPSITFVYDIAQRMIEAQSRGKVPVIFYFGDYDPSGEDIPRSIGENLIKDFGIQVEIVRCSLNLEQVKEYNLPPAPTKSTDSRTANWDGIGQVELDAMKPEDLERILDENVSNYFDESLYEDLQESEETEGFEYTQILKDFVRDIDTN